MTDNEIITVINGYLELTKLNKYDNTPIIKIDSINSFNYYVGEAVEGKDYNYILFNNDGLKWYCKNEKDTLKVYKALKEILLSKIKI